MDSDVEEVEEAEVEIEIGVSDNLSINVPINVDIFRKFLSRFELLTEDNRELLQENISRFLYKYYKNSQNPILNSHILDEHLIPYESLFETDPSLIFSV